MAERDRLVRDTLTIVVTGVVLGLAYNQLALANRPPRGLPWIARHEALESIESLQGKATRSDTAATSAAPGTASAAPGSSSPAPARDVLPPAPVPAAPRNPETDEPPTKHAAPASKAATKPVAPARAAPGEAPVSAPAPTIGLPEIPDAPRPLKIEIANVKRFVDAHAALIIDAREADEFTAGHLPGAINISVDDAARDPGRMERLDSKGMPIIVYCGGGDCEASRMIAESLMRDHRKKRVLVFEGGFPEWAAAGFPVAR